MIHQYPKIIFFIGCITIFFTLGCSSKATEETGSLKTNKQRNVAIKELKDNSINNKIDSRIAVLIQQTDNSQRSTSNALVKTKASQVQVYVNVASTEEKEIALLKNLGLEIEIINHKLKKIQAWVTLKNINRIAESDNVLAITPPSYGSPRIRKK